MATPMSWATFGPKLLYAQLLTRIPVPDSDFSGQTVIVTGSNTGLGLEAARHLVRLKAAKVILAVRTVSKGEAAAESILKSTGATKNAIDVWPLDLSNHESIKAFAKRAEKLERLDAVVQNAGMMTTAGFKVLNSDEAHIAVNVVGAVLLGLLLLPKLRETAKNYNTRTRLSFVGSDLHYVAKFQEAQTSGSLFEALNDKEKANISDRYSTSKLLLFYAVREIAARSPVSPDSNVIINVMTPGACKSDLFRDESPWYAKAALGFMQLVFARTTEVGGRILVGAVRPDLPTDAHGAFLMDLEVATNGPSVDSATGHELQERFNKELFARLERVSPGVTQALH